MDSLTSDFSWAVTGALQEHAAERTGVPCPASLLKKAPSARQAFPGSVLCLRDGSVHVVDFTGGVKSAGDATCLMLKPLLGGPAKQHWPAQLSESVDWITMGCLANKSFADTSNTPPTKLGQQAAAGIKLVAGSHDCRLVWDEQQHSIRLYTANGAVQDAESLQIGEIIDMTNQARVSWDVSPPLISQTEISNASVKPVDLDGFIPLLTKAVWLNEHQTPEQQQAEQQFAALQRNDASLVSCQTRARQHCDQMLRNLGVSDRSEFTIGFLGAFLAALADRQHLRDLAIAMLGASQDQVASAIAALFNLLTRVDDLDGRLISSAMQAAAAQDTPTATGDHRGRLLLQALRQPPAPAFPPPPAAQAGALQVAAPGGGGSAPALPALAAPAPVRQPVAPAPPPMPPPDIVLPPAAPGPNPDLQPLTTATRPTAIDWLTPAGHDLPTKSDAAATDWMRNMGGDAVQKFLATTSGVEIFEALTPLGQPASVKRSVRDVLDIARMLQEARAWTRDTSDPTWADERPQSWVVAKERLAQLLHAAHALRANEQRAAARAVTAPPMPPPPPAAPSPSSAILAAITNASRSFKPGEAKLEKATAAQKSNQVVCSSQVLIPLQSEVLITGENLIGSAATRGVTMQHELQRFRTLPDAGTAHAAAALVLSGGTRFEGDAQGPVPVNMVQARKDALAYLVGRTKEAVGRRRLTRDVRAKVDAMCEALLAGTVDLDAAVELLGGVAPADHTQLFGYAEANGTWGKISNREEIKKALSVVLSMIRAVHVPLLGMAVGPDGDFGLEGLLDKARLATVDRLATTLREAFALFTAQCEEYRESLAAATPCLKTAFAEAIVKALEPLAREQQTCRAAEAAAREVAAQFAKDAAARSATNSAQAAEIAKLRLEMAQLKRGFDPSDAGAPTRSHGHMTTRPYVTT